MRAARKPCCFFWPTPFMLCCITSVILSRTLRNFSKINFNELHPARLSSCSHVTQQQCKQSTGQYQLTWSMQLIIKINFFHDQLYPSTHTYAQQGLVAAQLWHLENFQKLISIFFVYDFDCDCCCWLLCILHEDDDDDDDWWWLMINPVVVQYLQKKNEKEYHTPHPTPQSIPWMTWHIENIGPLCGSEYSRVA